MTQRTNRRHLLRVGLTGMVIGTTGCLYDGEEDSAGETFANPDTTSRYDTTTDASSSATNTETERTMTESETETETTSNSMSKDRPEPTFTVAKDGSGDYRTLEDAYRVSRTGDVIGLGEGQYQYTPKSSGKLSGWDFSKKLTFVGSGRDNTTLTTKLPEPTADLGENGHIGG